jgi:hypothetical protein
MTKPSLDPVQLRLVETIAELGFGQIKHLSIRDGKPYFERPPRIVQEIKIDSEPQRRSDHGRADLTLKKQFETLFDQLGWLGDGTVDIEVRHNLPFKLVLERRYEGDGLL